MKQGFNQIQFSLKETGFDTTRVSKDILKHKHKNKFNFRKLKRRGSKRYLSYFIFLDSQNQQRII